MARPSAGASIRLAVTARSGSPAGGEGRLVEEVRERLRVPRGAAPSRRDLRHRARWGLAPIVHYLGRSLDEDEYDALTEDDLGDLVFELYKLAAARTRISRSYREIFENQ